MSELYVVDAEQTEACVYNVRDFAPVFMENKCCTSQYTPITIVELVHRLHGKTRIFLFFCPPP